MKMGVADIRLVHSIVVNIVDELLIQTHRKRKMIVTYPYVTLQHIEFYIHHIHQNCYFFLLFDPQLHANFKKKPMRSL